MRRILGKSGGHDGIPLTRRVLDVEEDGDASIREEEWIDGEWIQAYDGATVVHLRASEMIVLRAAILEAVK